MVGAARDRRCLSPLAAARIEDVVVAARDLLLGGLLRAGGGLLLPIAWTLLALGFAIEYLAWTVGLGAVTLGRYRRSPGTIVASGAS